MPVKSRWHVDIPSVTLQTYLFESPSAILPDTPVFIDSKRPDTHYLTHSGYRLWCQRVAAGLRKKGLKPGDRVLLYSGNSIFFPVVLLGVIMAGGVFTGANPTYVARELAYQLSDSGALFLIAAEGSLDTALEAAKIAGVGLDRVFIFDDGAATLEGRGKGARGVAHWSELIAPTWEGRNFVWEDPQTEEFANRTIALNYSSGTTGVPKGVQITHKNYVANTAQTLFIARLGANWEEKEKRTRWLCFLPMYHAMAQTIFCVAGPMRRIPTYIMPKFDFLEYLKNVQKFKITDMILVPPIVVALAKHPAVKQFDLSSVEMIGSGAAPLGKEVCEEVEKLWPDGKINVKQGWGMTEITCTCTVWPPDEISNETPASVGRLGPNSEAKIMDEDGVRERPRGERGELYVRGPHVMKGYWKKPEATKETITEDGWLKTGDVAVIDHDEKLYIVDRKKELIKVKGNQVAPAELEAILLEHQAVADAAVVGVTIKGEEAPRAYIVLKEGANASPEEIQKFMDGKVSRIKRLVGGVRFAKAIPKNPSGKILRRALREQANAEVGDTEARAARL